jgi:hypothetical protein
MDCDEGENQIDACWKFSQVATAVGSRKKLICRASPRINEFTE